MLHNPGGSGGVSLRNDRENRSFRKVVYIFHIPPAKWCICDIYHLQSGVYAIYTTCASIGKMAPLVYIYIFIILHNINNYIIYTYI